jgi:hypothetical protein
MTAHFHVLLNTALTAAVASVPQMNALEKVHQMNW